MITGLLSKLFQLRESVAQHARKKQRYDASQGTDRSESTDEDQDNAEYFDPSEKPFLAHLDDLRVTLFKLMLTLLVVTLFCFVFNRPLLDFIKLPLRMAFPLESDSTSLVVKPAASVDASAEASLPEIPLVLLSKNPEIRKLQEEVGSLRKQLELNELEQGNAQKALSSANPREQLVDMITIGVPDFFMKTLKLCMISGIVISFPLLLFFLGEFILPGLKNKEKKVLLPSLAVGFGLFLSGAAFCFYVVMPRVLRFFHDFSMDRGVQIKWTIEKYVGFASQLVLIFGLCFELPVVVMALIKIGMINYTGMKNTRAYAWVIIFVLGAIITPTPDALTLCLLAIPMIILYEICIWIAYFMEKRERRLYPELYTEAPSSSDENTANLSWDEVLGFDEEEKEEKSKPTEKTPSTKQSEPLVEKPADPNSKGSKKEEGNSDDDPYRKNPFRKR